MIIGVIVEMLAAVPCIVLGLLLLIKHKVSVLHDYHYKNVKEEDVPAYAKRMGAGLVVIGVGIGVTGILNLVNSAFRWVSLPAGFAAGLIIIVRAQKKYNGSFFG